MTATPQAIIQTPTLEQLRERLRETKAVEAEATLARIAIEEAILTHPRVASELSDEGTVTVDGVVKVTTGYTRKWDQAQLAEIAPGIDPAYWPFKAEFKEDRKAARVVEERFPDLWAQVRKALTLTPRKPTVAVVD